VSVEYPDLADYLAIAEAVTGLEVKTLSQVTNLDLADSTLHAPAAAFGDGELYPDFVDKAAVLLVRLAKTTSGPMATSAPPGDHAAIRRHQRVALDRLPLG
jgi:hypothetical protein